MRLIVIAGIGFTGVWAIIGKELGKFNTIPSPNQFGFGEIQGIIFGCKNGESAVPAF